MLNAAAVLVLSSAVVRADVDLLQRYPTKLTAGDTNPEQARSWELADRDIFRVTQFRLEVGKELRVEAGPADLACGHCADGALWAVLIPRAGGTLTRQGTNQEAIAHVWLRFHPMEISRLFPPETVFADGASNISAQARFIADAKMTSSWQAGGKAMIPEPKDMTVDVDTKDGRRRFFGVDTAAQTAEYVDAFSRRAVKPPSALTAGTAEAAFDQLWEAFDRDYAMFVLRPEVDWAKLREEYRPKALAAKSNLEFATVCADMLKPLRDLHIWITLAGAYVPVFNRPRTANSNPSAHAVILGDLQEAGRVQWAVTDDQIGFIAISMWNDPQIPAQCDAALEQMRNTRGLIVDVRLNGGGGEPLAEQFASRFLDKEFVYAYSQFRNGPAHTNLTEKEERRIAPRGPWRYDRPVVLLIGQKCMSSDESFVGMMTGDPQVTTMGDHTCGSSGNPEMINLPLDMTVSVPQWIDYLPDGTPLDERGFQPQVPFKPAPESFQGDRDDLLTAALERLRKAPLPDKPIAGPAVVPQTEPLPDRSAAVSEEAQDPLRPRLIAFTPTNGAEAVAPLTKLRLQFDRPMDPLALKLNWDSGGFLSCEFPSYDADKHEFTIPLRLAPGKLHQIVLNGPAWGYDHLKEARSSTPNSGFQSTDHQTAGLFVWHFRTQDPPPPSDAKTPKVIRISPAPGSLVSLLTLVEIQFDQPMAPPSEALPCLAEPAVFPGLVLVSHVEYDAAGHTFRFPLLLPANRTTRLKLAGFRGENGLPASPVKLSYQTADEKIAADEREKTAAAAKAPPLLELLESVKRQRMQMTSVSERVQTLETGLSDGLFTSLESHYAIFKWQNPDRYYGDVSGRMHLWAFRTGSDGRNWWFHRQLQTGTTLQACPVGDVRKVTVSFCDPFGLTSKTPAQAASDVGLRYAGVAQFEGSDCHLLEAWKNGYLTQWRIDSRNYRVAEITRYLPGNVWRDRFFYDSVNQPLSAEMFAVPKIEGQPPTPPEPLDSSYTNRFVRIRDGSDARMSLYWGKAGPKGSSGAGMN